MRDRNVALGNRPQAGQARFRGEQVVVALVQRLLGYAVANVEQAPARIEQEAEVGLVGQAPAALCQGPQAEHRRNVGGVLGRVGQFVTGAGEGRQVAAQVAAVDGRDVGRQQWGEGLDVDPVQDVAAVARQPVQRVQRVRAALQQCGGGDPAKLARAGQGQQVQADVGRRGALRDHHAGLELHVVGWQVVAVGADVGFEQPPGVACHGQQVGAVGIDDAFGGQCRPRPAGGVDPQWRGAPEQAQQRGQSGLGATGQHQRDRQHHGAGHHRPMATHDACQVLPRCRLGGCCGGPLQQVASADCAAPQRLANRAAQRQGLLQQQRQLPQRRTGGPQQLGQRLAVEVTQHHVIACGHQASQCPNHGPATERRGDQRQHRPARDRAAKQACQQQQQ